MGIFSDSHRPVVSSRREPLLLSDYTSDNENQIFTEFMYKATPRRIRTSRVQRRQWCRSMADINIYKSHCTQVYTSSHRFADINVSNVRF